MDDGGGGKGNIDIPTSPLRRQAMTREEAETMQRKSPATADPPKHASFIKRSLTIHVKTVVLGKLRGVGWWKKA